MGKILTRFRNPYAATSSSPPTPVQQTPYLASTSQVVSHNDSKRQEVMRLREVNNYSEFQNVLYTTTVSNSMCVFGIEDCVGH